MTQYNPNIHKRRSIRLKDYDYRSEGIYFLTICVAEKECLFGRIQNGLMTANELGCIVETEWLKSAVIRKEISLDDYVIMPNHFHALVIIDRGDKPLEDEAPSGFVRPAKSIPSLVSGFKGSVTRKARRLLGSQKIIWQDNYFEHIVRNQNSLDYIRYYIKMNPKVWNKDKFYVDLD